MPMSAAHDEVGLGWGAPSGWRGLGTVRLARVDRPACAPPGELHEALLHSAMKVEALMGELPCRGKMCAWCLQPFPGGMLTERAYLREWYGCVGP